MLWRAERRYLGSDEENGTFNVVVPAEPADVDASHQPLLDGITRIHDSYQQIMVCTIDDIHSHCLCCSALLCVSGRKLIKIY